jgi:hypothetical protein
MRHEPFSLPLALPALPHGTLPPVNQVVVGEPISDFDVLCMQLTAVRDGLHYQALDMLLLADELAMGVWDSLTIAN